MNNNITEDYCSFEVNRLLFKKGCDMYQVHPLFIASDGMKYPFKKPDEIGTYPCYTHALAIKWIRENFGINISILPFCISNIDIGDLKGHSKFFVRIDNRWNLDYSNDGKHIPYRDYISCWKFSSPEEATEAALLYILQNLIP